MVNRVTKATDLLQAANHHMLERAATYDSAGGERSMGKTVEAFNVITGHDLAEADGWLMMAILKMVRDNASMQPHKDSIEDFVAYASLYGEARIAGK